MNQYPTIKYSDVPKPCGQPLFKNTVKSIEVKPGKNGHAKGRIVYQDGSKTKWMDAVYDEDTKHLTLLT